MRRPLDRVGSLKLKLGVVIVVAVLVTVAILQLGRAAGWPTLPVVVAAVALALLMVQVLAHGMTFPLRQMARAATDLAAGATHEPVTATSRDEVGELARAFNRMAEELAETDRLRRDLVANVSHELRTPIAAMRALLENLVDGVEEPDPATLERLLRQSDRLQSLVEALLDLSRLEAGVVALDRERVDAASLVADVLDVTDATPGARLETHVDPPDLVVVADRRRLVQVLVNLVDNARRYAPEGTAVVLRAAQVGRAVQLSVADRGPGIPVDEAQRVFGRFQRGGSDGHVADGGSGLGLAISRWIVELHGGRVELDPGHRPGCRMVVSLPSEEERRGG